VEASVTRDKPNILLVLTDQQQGAMMRCAGNINLQTPSMDQVASEGTRFAHAFCTTPQCSASRASIMTGVYPHRHGVWSNIPDTDFGPPQLPTDIASLGTLLQNAGYHNAYFGKWHLGAADTASSNPTAYGFDHFVPTRFRNESESEAPLADEAADYLTHYHGPQPLMLVASFNDPHGVYQLSKVTHHLETDGIELPVSVDDDLLGKPEAQRIYREEDQPASIPHDDETARRYIAWYSSLVERADDYLGCLLRALDARADLNPNTYVVFASDHGDLAFAHRLPFKGPCMYEELIRVPLMIRGPHVTRGAVRNELVTLADLMPTICDWAGIGHPDGLDGESLVPLLAGAPQASWRDMVIGQYHGKQTWASPIRMIRTRRHKLTLYATGERELYDLVDDPAEIHNLSHSPLAADIETGLLERLNSWMSAQDDPFLSLRPTDRTGRRLEATPSIGGGAT
jgi:choline-sulfatase